MTIKDFALFRLKQIILNQLPCEGVKQLSSEMVFAARKDNAGLAEHRFDRPLISLLVQGRKNTVIGERKYEISENQLFTVGVDMPSSSIILTASREKPLLSLFFYLDMTIILELMRDNDFNFNNTGACLNGISVNDADDIFLETAVHLAAVTTAKPEDTALCRMILRELHYLLLQGPQRMLLQSLYGVNLPGRQIMNAVEYLKKSLDRPVKLAELANISCMSESTLYRQFKTLTGLSPLQYHKQLRLHEARRLMLAEKERASTAAWRTGYESVSQFNRDYKKLFGDPPRRDTKK